MTDLADDDRLASADALASTDGLPRGMLPPLRSRELPPPVPLRKMIGPSIMLAGLALGSGEFILWPYITYKSGFTFFWACVLGVVTQFFVNMEITRWALATGESVVTGFARLSKHWAGIFLFLNIVPWMIPAWAMGGATLFSWLAFGAEMDAGGNIASPHIAPLAIVSLIFCGIALTAGPVVYNTVEKIQLFLVSFIMLVAVALGFLLIRGDAWLALLEGLIHFRVPPASANLDATMLLGAIAFAGAGGTMNLCQSNYVKEKGYGMGAYIGRMMSPITGKDEAISETGYSFPTTSENLARWRVWWRAANLEHFLSFFCTCVICLFLMALISYSIYYTADGTPRADTERYTKDMAFLFGEAGAIEQTLGLPFRVAFLIMGIAILFTTEIGVLDAASRISTDIVKVNWLLNNKRWSEGRLYFAFLWGTISLASGIVLLGASRVENTLSFFKLTASLNGAVMFLYSGLLLYMNYRRLPAPIRLSVPRALMLAWSVLFFGFFAVWTAWDKLAG
ncbi:MAG: Nramp family divalent metal transporter [Planctomycetia bacterium]|nr:Nramp family divalent metal transporter [Planctomycetia bacterium]